ncbi:MAG: redoxin domain-containing protein [Microthrixaceae bacterium]
MQTWTIVGELGAAPGGDGPTPLLPADDLAGVTGWAPKPQGWCRGAECRPTSLLGEASVADELPAATIARLLDVAYAVDDEHRIVVIGSRREAAATLHSGVAPDLELPGVDGTRRRVFDDQRGKTLVVAFSSWCGCRYDLPGWNALRDELAAEDFDVVAVAIDERVEDAAPWAEGIDVPVLVDTERTFADAYGLINVPTVLWVDEDRRVVRRPSTEFSDDQFTSVHGVESGPHLDAVRRWVLDGELPREADRPDGALGVLDADQLQARAEFRLAVELARRGLTEAAAARVAAADALAPDDFTIWRAGMQLVGQDPFGSEFFERYTDWQQRHGGPLQVAERQEHA